MSHIHRRSLVKLLAWAVVSLWLPFSPVRAAEPIYDHFVYLPASCGEPVEGITAGMAVSN